MATRRAPRPETLSRSEAITLLRSELMKASGDDRSICRAAAERGIFCRGFRRDDAKKLAEKYDWIVRRNPGITRPQLEDIADRWQLARQEVHDLPMSCDVQTVEHDTCGGWDDFSVDELSSFIRELTGRRVVVA